MDKAEDIHSMDKAESLYCLNLGQRPRKSYPTTKIALKERTKIEPLVRADSTFSPQLLLLANTESAHRKAYQTFRDASNTL